MADTTDILGLRIPSADGSDVADLAAIIGNLGNDVDAAVGNPSLTTTEINALTGDAKAAGRRVWDSTLGVEKVSNGTTWEIQATKASVDTVAAAVPVITVGSYTGTPNVNGKLTIPLPEAPTGKVWYLFAHVINSSGHEVMATTPRSSTAASIYIWKTYGTAGPQTASTEVIYFAVAAA